LNTGWIKADGFDGRLTLIKIANVPQLGRATVKAENTKWTAHRDTKPRKLKAAA